MQESWPNARTLSSLMLSGVDGLPSLNNRTAMFVFFGQLIALEILMASERGCPIEMHKVHTEECSSSSSGHTAETQCGGGHLYMPFYRARYDQRTGQSPGMPREQINSKTSWIDAGVLYSNSESWASTIRAYERGRLRTDPNDEWMPPRRSKSASRDPNHSGSRAPFLLGDDRTNQNPALLSLAIMLFRWHNIQAARILRLHPDWSDETVFQKARRYVIAFLQNTVLYEYLPAFLNHTVPAYSGYKPYIHPGISHVFQSAAFRYGHTMIPPAIMRRDAKCNFRRSHDGYLATRLCNSWWNFYRNMTAELVDEFLLGIASQIAEREDSVFCRDMRETLFGSSEFVRQDLGAINIMRGRDNGLPDYNTARAFFQLGRIANMSHINERLALTRPDLFIQLHKLYRDRMDSIDLYVGGMLEAAQGRPGELFSRIVRDQFLSLRDGDRFWFENTENKQLTANEIEEIRALRLSDVIVATTTGAHTTRADIQQNVFFFAHDDPCPQPLQLNASDSRYGHQMALCEPVVETQTMSNQTKNLLLYFLIAFLLVVIPALTILSAHFVIRRETRRRRFVYLNKRLRQTATAVDASLKHVSLGRRTLLTSRRRARGGSGSGGELMGSEYQSATTGGHALDTRAVHHAVEWVHFKQKRRVRVQFGREESGEARAGGNEGGVDGCRLSVSVSTLRGVHLRTITLDTRLSVAADIDCARDGPEVVTSADADTWDHDDMHITHCDSQGSGQTQPSHGPLDRLRRLFAHIARLSPYGRSHHRPRKPVLILRLESEYDLVLLFYTARQRHEFLLALARHLAPHSRLQVRGHGTCCHSRECLLQSAETSVTRQHKLNQFFRVAYEQAFAIDDVTAAAGGGSVRGGQTDTEEAALSVRLTRQEFAQALAMSETDVFVRRMFAVVDKDDDGRISFAEFLDMVVLFARGCSDEKLRLIYTMCVTSVTSEIPAIAVTTTTSDIPVTSVTPVTPETCDISCADGASVCEVKQMLRSLVDLARTHRLDEGEVSNLVDEMFDYAGLTLAKTLSFEQFRRLVQEYVGELAEAGLDCKGVQKNFLRVSNNTNRSCSYVSATDKTSIDTSALTTTRWRECMDSWSTFVEENRQKIIYLFIFYMITLTLFVERFLHYSFLAEHTDLRHVMGTGIAVTRGAAASLSFCFALLLLTMCRNLVTRLKCVGALQQYIPLDAHAQFHKLVACTALIFTVLHSVGHLVNFYHVASQTVDNLRCLIGDGHAEDEHEGGGSAPTIGYWLFGTMTGVTGMLLYLIVCVMYIFSLAVVRKKAYSYFWRTHRLYTVFYLLCVVHGLARLTGSPRFWLFFIGPGIVFTLDKIVSLRTRYMKLDIIETELLPSDVLKIKFYRPPNVQYHSGQWIRMACTAVGNEYHSFTLTSAPHENFLQVHIKAHGPWTWKLRNYFDPVSFIQNDSELPPRIQLEGPFGGGNQDWYKFEVAIMIGGGIGVTPYASILNDLVFGTSTNRYSGVSCKKVYFLWVCRSQRSFEWFIDVLRDVEERDVTNVLDIHIFITQFFHKFDLRTTMLYICEKHFQRISGRSMFTGLKASNHFGRPNFELFFRHVKQRHNYISNVGVFSCGPSTLTKSISKVCEDANKSRKLPYFVHHCENFS